MNHERGKLNCGEHVAFVLRLPFRQDSVSGLFLRPDFLLVDLRDFFFSFRGDNK